MRLLNEWKKINVIFLIYIHYGMLFEWNLL